MTKEGYKEIEEQLSAVFKFKVTATSGKKNWIDNQCRIIEERMAQGDRKKTLSKTDQQKTSVIEDSNENRKNAAVLSRLPECCNDLYNFQLRTDDRCPPKQTCYNQRAMTYQYYGRKSREVHAVSADRSEESHLVLQYSSLATEAE